MSRASSTHSAPSADELSISKDEWRLNHVTRKHWVKDIKQNNVCCVCNISLTMKTGKDNCRK
jgi:hypothetical protein